MNSEASAHLAAGEAALGAFAWEEARDHFAAALAIEDSPEGAAGLARAAWATSDLPLIAAEHERAYRLYHQRGDRVAAAGAAIFLAIDAFELHGKDAIADGWLSRARQLLDGREDVPEAGMLAAVEGHLYLMQRNDTTFAKAAGREAARLGRALGEPNIEMRGIALEGLALVSEGQVEVGMRRLELANAAIALGEVNLPDSAIVASCYLIDAYSRVRDYSRASQWCEQFIAMCERFKMNNSASICRPLFAVVLMWRGQWGEAESELTTSIDIFSRLRPAMAVESIVRKAEMRTRQGRLEDADELFARVEREPLAQVGRAHLAFVRGDTELAADLLTRYLRRIPVENRIERAPALELATRVAIAMGDLPAARAHCSDLVAAAQQIRTAPLHAAAAATHAVLTAAEGDHQSARHCFEEAIDILGADGAPYESAQARLALAASLDALERPKQALRERLIARDLLRGIGSIEEVPGLPGTDSPLVVLPPALRGPGGEPLTEREVEVLALLARGKSNQAIAEELVLSVRTVERHITTIYGKLGAAGRVARTTATLFAIERGLLAG